MKIRLTIDRYVSVAALSSLLSVVGVGCGTDGEPGGADVPAVSVGLYTRTQSGAAEEGAASRRALVFNENGACVANYSFVPGSGELSLKPGTYRMATLSVPKGLILPVAGDTQGITPDLRLSFAAGDSVGAFSLGTLEVVTVGTAYTSYTATLAPVTGVLSLRVSGMPEGRSVEFELTGMYASVGLDGTYEGSRDYPLSTDGETVCLPTPKGATLTYRIDGGDPRKLETDRELRAGNRLELELAWKADLSDIAIRQVMVTDWLPGGGDGSGVAN